MNYIDVHCHLDYTTYGDLPALISALDAAGVKKVITVGFDLPSSYLARDIAQSYDGVYFAAGYHPTELAAYKEEDLKEIKALCAHPKCVALGEIGLDYHYADTDKELQKAVFVRQLCLANELGLPVQIHSRDCAEDMLSILNENAELLKNGALMHCYSHSTELAAEFLKSGVSFSFGGASTWKSAKKARATIAMLPSDKILSETDSPYMAPQSVYHTFPNTPLAIPEICASFAHIRGVTEEEVAKVAWNNAHNLFKKLQ